jgi:hypothetical protein
MIENKGETMGHKGVSKRKPKKPIPALRLMLFPIHA